MKITFDEKTASKIKTFADEGAVLVFDFDHTISEKNVAVDSCAGGISRYRIVAIDPGTLPDLFDGQIESEFGPLYYKTYGGYFFHETMDTRINTAYNLIELHSPAETLSQNLLIVDFRGKEII